MLSYASSVLSSWEIAALLPLTDTRFWVISTFAHKQESNSKHSSFAWGRSLCYLLELPCASYTSKEMLRKKKGAWKERLPSLRAEIMGRWEGRQLGRHERVCTWLALGQVFWMRDLSQTLGQGPFSLCAGFSGHWGVAQDWVEISKCTFQHTRFPWPQCHDIRYLRIYMRSMLFQGSPAPLAAPRPSFACPVLLWLSMPWLWLRLQMLTSRWSFPTQPYS